MEADSLAESAMNICTCAGATAISVLVCVVIAEGVGNNAGWQLVVQCFALVDEKVRRLFSSLNREGAKKRVDR